ncbi:WD40-repeat-containing domain protein [Peziza echinospora]|nr:WD40-repeat-containing domain protein [Peziza echinospora]
MIYPLPPTFSNLYITPQSTALHGQAGPRVSPRGRFSQDRFIPSSTSVNAFRMSTPLHLLSGEEKLLRRSNGDDIFGNLQSRSISPSSRTSPSEYRGRLSQASGITAAGRAIYVGAGSSRGTEVNINIFGDQESPEAERERHEARLAAALGVDRCARVLRFVKEPTIPTRPAPIDGWSQRNENSAFTHPKALLQFTNNFSGISKPRRSNAMATQALTNRHTVPSTPFRVLDAPGLRDDYYCSLLAYSPLAHSLAVGLHSDVYTWTETSGATPFEHWSSSHVTCLAFSSTVGKRNILAIGRIDGNLCLWKPGEPKPRVDRTHTAGVACISWRPVLQKRWDASFSAAGGAKLRLLKKIVAHTQQICGLCWSGDGNQFATGGNDNVACLFNVQDVFTAALPDESREAKVRKERGRYRWVHGAAVKAMAFCPWQRTLLATGGGSNDRCIHFYHTYSGACLATINVSAQVTSLLWSNSHREIAATFGYANPDHPIRIAVFSWPECKQVAAIPWGEDMRALYAVGYPGGPIEDSPRPDATGSRGTQRHSDGCIVVAASDETVRFHEVWSECRKGVVGWRGVLGGSDILEGLEGIEKDGGEMIR